MRLARLTALGFAWISLALASASCKPTADARPPRAAPVETTLERPSYTPGLGEIMTLTQMRHLKLWLAIDAQNWDLAAYELDELEEGLADAIAFHPQHKSAPRPLAEIIPETMDAPIAALRSALAARDRAKLEQAHDALTDGCNGCHAAAGFSFNRVIRPQANPYSNQAFEPSAP
jgi:hypothetical protein